MCGALRGDYRPLLPLLQSIDVGTFLLELCTPRAGEPFSFNADAVLASDRLIPRVERSLINSDVEDIADSHRESGDDILPVERVVFPAHERRQKRRVDRHNSRFRVDDPHPTSAGGEIVGDLGVHGRGRIAWRQNFDGQIRRSGESADGVAASFVAFSRDECHIGATHRIR